MAYEGIGHMVSTAQADFQVQLVGQVLMYVNNDWERIIGNAMANPLMLMEPEVLKTIDQILKVNQRIARSVGAPYLHQLVKIFDQLMKVYGHYSQNVSQSVQQGKSNPTVKPMKQVRRDILKLIQIYIENETNFDTFNQNILPTLQQMVQDYADSNPQARDPETLMLFATILSREGS